MPSLATRPRRPAIAFDGCMAEDRLVKIRRRTWPVSQTQHRCQHTVTCTAVFPLATVPRTVNFANLQHARFPLSACGERPYRLCSHWQRSCETDPGIASQHAPCMCSKPCSFTTRSLSCDATWDLYIPDLAYYISHRAYGHDDADGRGRSHLHDDMRPLYIRPCLLYITGLRA